MERQYDTLEVFVRYTSQFAGNVGLFCLIEALASSMLSVAPSTPLQRMGEGLLFCALSRIGLVMYKTIQQNTRYDR